MKKIVFLLMFLYGCVYGQENKFTLSGTITDCKTHCAIINVSLKLVGSDGSSIETMNDSSGYYYFDTKRLNKNTKYVITAQATNSSVALFSKSKRGYLSSSDRYKFDTFDSTRKEFVYDFCLLKAGCIMLLPLYYFEKNNSNDGVKDEEAFDLETMRQFMEDNPNLVVEIGGHSSFDEKKPEIIAKKRAETIKMFLVAMGVEPERLVVKSYSNTKSFELLNEDTGEITLADKNDKRNRRVVMNIISKDNVPKKTKKEQPKNINSEEDGE